MESQVTTTLVIFVVLALSIIVLMRRFRSPGVSVQATPPAYELIKRVESADAVRALEIFRGDHGLFRFDEMKWHEPEIDDPYEGYWVPTTCSGLYESAEAAERDARAELAWLRETVRA